MQDQSTIHEGPATVGAAAATSDEVRWHAAWKVEKFNHAAEQLAEHPAVERNGQTEAEILRSLGYQPDEVLEGVGNLLMYGGASVLWEALEGNASSTPGQVLTKFDNTNAAIGVGDSATAAVATTNDLVAVTNKLRKGMDATYPQHTDGVIAGSASIVFRSTFATGDANWAWAEWGVFNSPTAATGRMLNRKVEALGTKTSAASWVLTITLTLA